MYVSRTAALQNVLFYSHLLIPVQGPVLPLLTALSHKDLDFRRSPPKYTSEQTDSEAMQALNVVRKCVLIMRINCQGLSAGVEVR
jgi:hypothetical protein